MPGMLRRSSAADLVAWQSGPHSRACSPAGPRHAGYLLGKASVPKYAIITALAGAPTPNLAAFVEALKVGVSGRSSLQKGARKAHQPLVRGTLPRGSGPARALIVSRPARALIVSRRRRRDAHSLSLLGTLAGPRLHAPVGCLCRCPAGPAARAARAPRVLHLWRAPPPQVHHPARQLELVRMAPGRGIRVVMGTMELGRGWL